jgi:hypothetical protein
VSVRGAWASCEAVATGTRQSRASISPHSKRTSPSGSRTWGSRPRRASRPARPRGHPRRLSMSSGCRNAHPLPQPRLCGPPYRQRWQQGFTPTSSQGFRATLSRHSHTRTGSEKSGSTHEAPSSTNRPALLSAARPRNPIPSAFAVRPRGQLEREPRVEVFCWVPSASPPRRCHGQNCSAGGPARRRPGVPRGEGRTPPAPKGLALEICRNQLGRDPGGAEIGHLQSRFIELLCAAVEATGRPMREIPGASATWP